jgi:hypothetical protein
METPTIRKDAVKFDDHSSLVNLTEQLKGTAPGANGRTR